MRNTLAAAAATAILLAGTTAPASAVQAPNDTNFHGTWTSWVHGNQDAHEYYGGHWNVSIKKDGTANMSMVLFDEPGQIYTTWGGNVWRIPFIVTSQPGEYPIRFENDDGLKVTLQGDGFMRFSFVARDGQSVVITGVS